VFISLWSEFWDYKTAFGQHLDGIDLVLTPLPYMLESFPNTKDQERCVSRLGLYQSLVCNTWDYTAAFGQHQVACVELAFTSLAYMQHCWWSETADNGQRKLPVKQQTWCNGRLEQIDRDVWYNHIYRWVSAAAGSIWGLLALAVT